MLAGTPAAAQVDTGTLLGTVKDQSGGVLPGATVTVTHEGQGFSLSTVTREDGTFIITPIRTGTYTVRVEFPGFRNTERRGIGVSIQQSAVVDVTLETGSLTEDVVVTANAPLLETGNGTVGQTLRPDREPADQRPRLHDPRAPQHRRRAAAARRARAADVHGQRRPPGPEQLHARRHRQQHEQRRLPERRRLHRQAAGRRGRRNQDPHAARSAPNTGAPAAPCSARRSSRAPTQFRGSVWEFNRDDGLNATDFFDNRANLEKAEYKSNQFGLTAGGPIQTGKTFFFADYEGSLIKQGRIWVRTVPTAAQRDSGFTDFSDLITLQSGNVGTDLLGRTFPLGTMFDPATTRQVVVGQVDPVTGSDRDARRLRARLVRREPHPGRPARARTPCG